MENIQFPRILLLLIQIACCHVWTETKQNLCCKQKQQQQKCHAENNENEERSFYQSKGGWHADRMKSEREKIELNENALIINKRQAMKRKAVQMSLVRFSFFVVFLERRWKEMLLQR